ncbi:MAG: NACHT domain-containing protein [Alphaproteobacteria bacterium]|nr:NACHT domain-containing protein [Alphaproteobacteria bacterium]
MSFSAEKYTAELTIETVKELWNRITLHLQPTIRKKWTAAFEDFKPYVARTKNKTTKIKILLKKDSDVGLNEIYIPLNFKNNDTILPDSEIINEILKNKNVIIQGNGGAGKTIFMRFLWNVILEETNTIPIFLELRMLNNLSTENTLGSGLVTLARTTISESGKLDEDTFRHLMGIGKFTFILDGFDEIVEDKKHRVENEIIEISSEFQKCRFIVSSRLNQRFNSWSGFNGFECCKLNLDQNISLIEKLPFHEKTKREFLKEIMKKDFSSKKSLMSTPLLTMMMLLTFSDTGTISDSLNIFYDHAFIALYNWHNSTKEKFTKVNELDFHVFRNAFSVFSLVSYMEQRIEFTEVDILETIQKSNKIAKIDVDPQKTLRDFSESVNLIQRDGKYFTFLHRSFQEYFAAYGLIYYQNQHIDKFMERLKNRYFDDFPKFCYSMNPPLFVKKFVEPQFEKHLKPISRSRNPEKPYYALSKLQFTICFEEFGKDTGITSFSFDDELFSLLHIASRISGKKQYQAYSGKIFHEFLKQTAKSVHHYQERGQSDEPLTITISFSDSACKIRCEDIQELSESDEELYNEIERILVDCEGAFKDINDNFHKEMNSVRHWCQKEIRDNSSIDDDIEDLFKT